MIQKPVKDYRRVLDPKEGDVINIRGTYVMKSIRDSGGPVACLYDVEDEEGNFITDHIWIRLNKQMNRTLSAIKLNQRIKVKAKVIKYGMKYGLEPIYLGYIQGVKYKGNTKGIKKEIGKGNKFNTETIYA